MNYFDENSLSISWILAGSFSFFCVRCVARRSHTNFVNATTFVKKLGRRT